MRTLLWTAGLLLAGGIAGGAIARRGSGSTDDHSGDAVAHALARAEKAASESTEQARAAVAAESAVADRHAALLRTTWSFVDAYYDEFAPAERELDLRGQAMRTHPSADDFERLKAALGRARTAADKTSQTFDALEELLNKKAAQFERVRDVADALRARDAELVGTITASVTGIDTLQRSLRQARATVFARADWQSSPITVAAGDTVCVAAPGQWRWAPNAAQVGVAGADRISGMRIVAEAKVGALIARVHGSEQPVAAAPSFVADRDGALDFRINDATISDNDGQLDLTVWIGRFPDPPKPAR